MTYLLDVNVLIALIDPAHPHKDAARAWFLREGQRSWATCPITENGVLRIVAHPRYLNAADSPARVVASLAAMRALPGHQFWTDDISLIGADHVDPTRLTTHRQVTDTYLLALAVARRGRLATFDRRLLTAAVQGGDAALHLLPSPHDVQ